MYTVVMDFSGVLIQCKRGEETKKSIAPCLDEAKYFHFTVEILLLLGRPPG